MSAQHRDTAEEASVPVELTPSGGIGRRAVLQSLAGGLGAGLVVPALGEAQHPVHQHLANQKRVTSADKKAAAAAYKPEFLDAHQMQTLEVLAERIVPGSTKAKVAPFIDQLLAVDSPDNQKAFLSAMGAFEMMAIDKAGKPWKALGGAQQDELLTAASTAEAGLTMPGYRAQSQVPVGKTTIRDHFDNLRGWISGAYYSSEIGMRELGWTGEMFFAELPGCTHPEGHGD
jgi:hypothetical protein